MLENKILKMEGSSNIDMNSKEKISQNLTEKMNELQEEINILNQKIKDCAKI